VIHFSTLSLRFNTASRNGVNTPALAADHKRLSVPRRSYGARAAATGPGRASADWGPVEAPPAVGATSLAEFYVNVDFKQRRK